MLGRVGTETLKDLATVADELYALSPDAFTSARNERAKQAKAEGDKELAEAVKRLPKASTAAWVVNMLVRHHAEQVEQVLDLGVALRQAQENLAGEELRELTRQRRQLTSAVTRQARALAFDLGQRVSEAVAQQVEGTLHAAMIDEDAAKAVRSGLLTEALSATGLGHVDVSGAVAVPSAVGVTARPAKPLRRREPVEPPPKPELTVVPDYTHLIDEAKRAVKEADASEAKAERLAAKARKDVDRLEARSLQLQAKLEELRNRISEVEHGLEACDDEITDAEAKREAAVRAHTQAAEQAGRARAELERLERKRS